MTEFHLENPNNGQSEEAFSRIDNDGIQDVLTRTTKAFASWRETDIDTRAAVLEKTADIYEQKTDELADHIGREMGKPTDQAKAELQIVVDIYRYYAQHAHELLADKELYSDDAQRTFVAKEPLGPLVGVMPWNFPYYQVARFAAPNLLLGNTIVLKHASICPLSSQACQDIFAEAGLPDDVFINVYASGKQVAKFLEDKRIKGVSLTGSEVAGASVAETAGKHLKKSLLELGGNDPFIVLDDSNLEWVLDQYVAIRMTNTGQVCNAPKRLIVMEDVYDRVLDYLTEKIGNLKPGAYNEPDADFGPLSSVGARDEVVETITAAEQNGDARIVVGGDKLDREGAYMTPRCSPTSTATPTSPRARSSARLPCCSRSRTSRRPSSWPMTSTTAWAAPSGAPTWRPPRRSLAASSAACRWSTRPPPLSRICLSAASAALATAASSTSGAWRSS